MLKSRKVFIDFPDAKGRYWYLYWIDKIYFENKSFKVDLYFVNTLKSDSYLKNFQLEITHKIRVSVGFLFEFEIGTIYDSIEKRIVINNLGLVTIKATVKKGLIYKSTKSIFPLTNHKYFPKVEGLENNEIGYHKYISNNFENKYTVFVSPYNFANYFLFKSSTLIKKLFAGNVINAFYLDKLNIFRDMTNNTIVAELAFNRDKIKESEAVIISKFLFFKNKTGINMINSIYSSIQKSFRENAGRKVVVSGYLDLKFEFGGYSLELIGKSYYGAESDKYFLSSKISNLKFDDNPYLVDRIILIPLSSKTEKKNDLCDGDDRVVITTPTEGLNIYLNKRPTHVRNTAIDYVKDEDQNPFGIDVEVIPFSYDESTKENFNLIAGEADGMSRGEEELLDIQDDLIILEQNIERIREEITVIENLKYFAKVIEYLNEYEDVTIDFDPLGIGESEYPIRYHSATADRSFRIDLVLAIKDNCYFIYLIEFGFGNIGVFRNLDPTEKIDVQMLHWLIQEFVNTDTEALGYKILWTAINRTFKVHQKNIFLELGIEHTRVHKEDPTKVTADRIYRKRLLNFNETAKKPKW